jgi:ubiquinol-cytochrome c reductase cytochrome c subunit
MAGMTPERREVTGAVVVGSLALTAVGITGFALAAFIAEGFSGRSAAVQAGGFQEAATSGRVLFRQFCARCHGVQAQGRTVAPPLANVGLGREEVEVVVREGIPPLMPAFGKRLRSDQVQAIAEYVASLSGDSGPHASAEQGAAPGGARQPGRDRDAETSGRLVFRRQCASCHGAQAQGRGAAPPLTNVGLGREEVEAAVREGIPPLMPPFGNRLRPDEIRAVADYVAALNPSVRAGGQIAGGDAWLPGMSRGRMRGMGCPCPMMGRRD